MRYLNKNAQHILTSLAVVAMGVASVWFTPSKPSGSISTFSITIEHTHEEGRAICEEGCNWEEVTWECSGEDSCRVQLDQSGVSSAPPNDSL